MNPPTGKEWSIKTRTTILMAILLVAMLLGFVLASSEAESACLTDITEAERQAMESLAEEIKGAVVYTKGGRVRKVVIGIWKTTDLGEGDFVRWGPKGMKIAVYYKGVIYVVDADGTNRKRLVTVGGKAKHCPIEFHTNGKEIIYVTPSKELRTVRIIDGTTRDFDLSGKYNGEPGISADGNRLVARHGHNLYAIDLSTRQIRKYGWGCSSGISPDGNWLMNNLGNHREMVISTWDGQKQIKTNSETCQPDKSWDNHHWSNNNDYITAQGSENPREAYVFCISKNHGTRLTWEGGVVYPDLFVANGGSAIQ